MDAIELDGFLNLHYLSNLSIGEGAKSVFFTLKKANLEEDNYDSFLYVYEDGKAFPFLEEAYGGLYVLEDKGNILYLAKGEKDEATAKFIRVNNGQKKEAFTLPFIPSSIRSVKKGTYLLATQIDLNDPHAYKDTPEKKEKKKALAKQEEDYIVLTESPFYFNGQGYIDRKRMALFLYQEKGNVLTPIHIGSQRIAAYDFTEKGVYFFADKGKAKETQFHDLYYFDFAKGKAEKILATEINVYSCLVWGNKLLIWGSVFEDYGVNENPRFFTFDPKTKKILPFFANDDGCGSSVGSDIHLGGGRVIKEDRGDLYYLTTERNKSVIRRLDPYGRVETLVDKEGGIIDFDIRDNEIYLLADYGMKATELYRREKDKIAKLTTINDKALKGRYVAKPTKINFNSCGYDIDGFILAPKDYDTKKKYPAILDIHGGPKTVYGEVYYHEMQVWASLGYFVIFCNPFGGDGRGNRFADLRGKYGSIDYNNIMDFVDAVLAKYPAIDRSKLGATGGSYGGFMTNWIVTHTRRFKAAATQRSISNWLSMAGTSDIGYLFAEDQCGGKLLEDDGAEILWEHSPLKYGKNLKTPLLVIHSDCDYRCPLEQGYQIYSCAVENGTDARMVIFKSENHDLSRSGKPSHRKRRLEEITSWFEKYLKKKGK